MIESHRPYISGELQSTTTHDDATEGEAQVKLISSDEAKTLYSEKQQLYLLWRKSTFNSNSQIEDDELTETLSATIQGQQLLNVIRSFKTEREHKPYSREETLVTDQSAHFVDQGIRYQ